MSRALNDIRIRFATLDDAGLLLRLIRDLAAYERAPNAVVAETQSSNELCFSTQSGPYSECRGRPWNCLQNGWREGSRSAPIGTHPRADFYGNITVVRQFQGGPGWAPVYTVVAGRAVIG